MICTQPVQNDLMPLSEAKSKNFLTAQSWRHFKITEADKEISNRYKEDLIQVPDKGGKLSLSIVGDGSFVAETTFTSLKSIIQTK
ncbi:hypothetical protein pb186bvf_012193 [Paramecium bursaria]